MCAFALLFGTTAHGAYNPVLLVGETSPALGGSGSVRIFLETRQRDDATGMITVYSPRGYELELAQPAGNVLGSVIVFVKVGSPGAAIQAAQGMVRTDHPGSHASPSCAPGTHDAVWLIEFMLGGVGYRLPIYVDRITSGAEAAYASARMRLCPASPSTLQPQGIALTYADLTIGGVFRNPGARGTYAWNAVFVPYAPGTATLDPASTAQSTSYIGLPAVFSVSAKRWGRHALVTACLREADQAIRGIRITLYYGGKTVFSSKPVARRYTDARGCVSARFRIRKTNRIFLSARVPIRPAPGCGPALAPRCTRASIYPPPVRFRAVRIRG